MEWHLQLGSAENWGRHEGLWGWVGGGEEGVYLQRNFTSMWSLSGLSMYGCLNNPAPGQRGLQENSAEFMSEAKNRNSPTSSQWLQSDHHGDPNYRNQAGPFSRTIPWLSATLGIVGLYLDAFLGEGMSNWQTEPDPLKKKKIYRKGGILNSFNTQRGRQDFKWVWGSFKSFTIPGQKPNCSAIWKRMILSL